MRDSILYIYKTIINLFFCEVVPNTELKQIIINPTNNINFNIHDITAIIEFIKKINKNLLIEHQDDTLIIRDVLIWQSNYNLKIYKYHDHYHLGFFLDDYYEYYNVNSLSEIYDCIIYFNMINISNMV